MIEKSIRFEENIPASLRISARDEHKDFYAHVVEEGGSVVVTRYFPKTKTCVAMSPCSQKKILHKRHLASCQLHATISQL